MSVGGADIAAAPGAAKERPVLAPIADLTPPPVCIVCRTRIGGHGLICGTCFAKIDFIAPPLCDRLGVPLPYDISEGGQLSAAAIAKPPVYDRARAVARYSSTMRELIQSFKYHDRHKGVPPQARVDAIKDKKIVVIDDVITTGATAEACGGPCAGQVPRRSTFSRLRAPSSRPQIPLRKTRFMPSYLI